MGKTEMVAKKRQRNKTGGYIFSGRAPVVNNSPVKQRSVHGRIFKELSDVMN